MDSQLDIMDELVGEGDIDALMELLEESIKPLIEYRVKKEKEIATKAINEMYQLEEQAIGKIEQKQVYNYLGQGVR